MQKIKNFIKSIAAVIYFPFLVPAARRKIIKTRESVLSPEEIYDWTEKFCVGPNIRGLNIVFRSAQVKNEILVLLSELKKNPPRIILEIGTATGGTLFMFSRVARPDAEIISIDLPFGPFGAGYFKYRVPLYQEFAGSGQKINLLRCDSHLEQTELELKKILDGRLIDFLFIDGDHGYEGAKKDFDTYKKYVRPGGLIALHDIAKTPKDSKSKVEKLWAEIRGQYKSEEYINNQNQQWAGIGIIHV